MTDPWQTFGATIATGPSLSKLAGADQPALRGPSPRPARAGSAAPCPARSRIAGKVSRLRTAHCEHLDRDLDRGACRSSDHRDARPLAIARECVRTRRFITWCVTFSQSPHSESAEIVEPCMLARGGDSVMHRRSSKPAYRLWTLCRIPPREPPSSPRTPRDWPWSVAVDSVASCVSSRRCSAQPLRCSRLVVPRMLQPRRKPLPRRMPLPRRKRPAMR